MKYLLRTNTSNEHLEKKFERTVSTYFGRDGSEIAVCLRRFFVRLRFLASENGLYELASTFCHVPRLVCHSAISSIKKKIQFYDIVYFMTLTVKLKDFFPRTKLYYFTVCGLRCRFHIQYMTLYIL